MPDPASPPRARGACHCGALSFEIRGKLRDVLICHCSDCRRHNGHASAHTRCATSDLHFHRRDTLKWYDSSPSGSRGFCTACGSIVFFQRRGVPFTAISAGCLEPPTGLRTAMHIFVPDKSDYYEICDDTAPRRAGMPDEAELAAFRWS
jgi:hypothetical protein